MGKILASHDWYITEGPDIGREIMIEEDGDNNWKGKPECYLDSAIKGYIQYLVHMQRLSTTKVSIL